MTDAERRPPAALALTRAFKAIQSRALPATVEESDDLRSKVCELTDEMKKAGATPEQVVIRLRALASAAGFDGFADPLVSEAVRWCLDRYFPAEREVQE